MKRLITLLSVFLLINVFAFSNFFTSRFFEIKAGTDLSLSNNVMSSNDVLKKDLVIDLRKIAEDCPASGFNVVASMQPSVEMNLNIKILSIGFSSGVEMYEKWKLERAFLISLDMVIPLDRQLLLISEIMPKPLLILRQM